MIAGGYLRSLSVALVAASLALSSAGQSDPQDTNTISDQRLDQALEAYQADEDLQRERPVADPEFDERELRERNEPGPILRAIANFFSAIGSVLGYLLILLVIIAIAAGLYMVFGEQMTLRGRKKEDKIKANVSVDNTLRPEPTKAKALLEDADALAAQGRFAEAVHLLLFRSIDDIQEKKSGAIGRSLTAREIGSLGLLPEQIRGALTPIIRIVERSFFGGRDVDETGWQEARASYERFAFGEVWA
ncbi:MAG: hypothetical protein AAFO74_06445 [Pseudomonadota bacterium]